MGWLLAFALLVVFVVINLFAFAMFGVDKRASQDRAWRVPESTLLFAAFIGGSIGAIMGQHYFRHKTRKEPFRSHLNCIVVLQVLVFFALCYGPTREAILNAFARGR